MLIFNYQKVTMVNMGKLSRQCPINKNSPMFFNKGRFYLEICCKASF
ncbi:MAG: hypothetical protein JWP44_3218 [Mucilaginibacter sp.]|nr:hypothetical protein [Mucilaginibacter sp.]